MNADRRSRPLVDRLRDGDQVLGLIVKMPAPAIVEVAGWAGFDVVVIDTEHGLADGYELQHHLRAADSVGLPALVRVPSPAGDDILRALDAGAHGIVVPHVSSAGDVGVVLRAARYPPDGRRSLALSTRSGRYGHRAVSDHLAAAARQTLIIAQIEDGLAVEHARAIAGAPGLGGVFIGPTDLSASLGVAGELDHPTVIDAIERIAVDVLASSEAALCVIARDEREAAQWLERGASIVLFEASAVMADRLRDLMAVAETALAPMRRAAVGGRSPGLADGAA